jgi:hypothetical protein
VQLELSEFEWDLTAVAHAREALNETIEGAPTAFEVERGYEDIECEGGKDAAVFVSTIQRQTTIELIVCDVKYWCIGRSHGEGSQRSGDTHTVLLAIGFPIVFKFFSVVTRVFW